MTAARGGTPAAGSGCWRYLLAATGALIGAVAPGWAAGTVERVSVSTAGVQANGESFFASAITPDGRFVAFQSEATNLVPGDNNGATDVFLRDRQAGTTERVSVGAGGAEANAGSGAPTVSADGRFVAFASGASNLVPGDTNRPGGAFVRDRRTGMTRRVSVGPGGVPANNAVYAVALSANGRFVAFNSEATNLVPGDTNGRYDVFVRDLVAGKTTRVSVGPGGTQANSDSFPGAVSMGGRFVAFLSFASNLVPGDTNRKYDVFVRAR